MSPASKDPKTIRPSFTNEEWVELKKQAGLAKTTLAQYVEDLIRERINEKGAK